MPKGAHDEAIFPVISGQKGRDFRGKMPRTLRLIAHCVRLLRGRSRCARQSARIARCQAPLTSGSPALSMTARSGGVQQARTKQVDVRASEQGAAPSVSRRPPRLRGAEKHGLTSGRELRDDRGGDGRVGPRFHPTSQPPHRHAQDTTASVRGRVVRRRSYVLAGARRDGVRHPGHARARQRFPTDRQPDSDARPRPESAARADDPRRAPSPHAPMQLAMPSAPSALALRSARSPRRTSLR